MKTKHIFAIAAALLGITSCSQDETAVTDSSSVVELFVTIGDGTRTQPQAIGSESAKFNVGDRLFVRLENNPPSAGCYTFNGNGWDPTDPVFWDGGTDTHPLFVIYPEERAGSHEVPLDQSTEELISKADYMTGYKIVNKTEGPVHICMERQTSRFVVNLTNSSYEYEGRNLVVSDERFVRTDDNQIEFKPYKDGSRYVILTDERNMPDAFTFNVTFDDGSVKPFVARLPIKDIKFDFGYGYNFNILIGKADVKVEEVSITPWTDATIPGGEEINSEDSQVIVDRDLNLIHTSKPGLITEDMVRKALDGNTTLHLKGKINNKDISIIRPMQEVEKLDLSEVKFVNDAGDVTAVLPSRIFEKAQQKEINLPDYLEGLEIQTFVYSNIEAINIPAGVRSLPESCFQGCRNLSSVKFADDCKVESFIKYCFHFCENLKTLDIPSSVKKIENGCFLGTGLTSLVIPESVTTIGDGIFSSNTSLSTLTIKTKKEGSDINPYFLNFLHNNQIFPNREAFMPIHLIIDDSWFGPLEEGEEAYRQAVMANAPYPARWMNCKYKKLSKLSEIEPELPSMK